MRFYPSLWVLMGLNRSLFVLMDSNVFLWGLKGLYAFLWIRMGPYGSLIVLTDSNGF